MARVWREFNVMNPTPEEAYMLDRGITGTYVNEPDPVPPPPRRPIVAEQPAAQGQQIVRDIYGGTPSAPSQYARSNYASAPAPAPRRARAAAPRRPAARPAPRPAVPAPAPAPMPAPMIAATPFSDSLRAQGMQPDPDRIASATQHAYDLQRVFGDIPSAPVYEMQQVFDNTSPAPAPVIQQTVPPVIQQPVPPVIQQTVPPVVQQPAPLAPADSFPALRASAFGGDLNYARNGGSGQVPTPLPASNEAYPFGTVVPEMYPDPDYSGTFISDIVDRLASLFQTNPGTEEEGPGAWD